MSLWDDFPNIHVLTESPAQLRHHDLVGLVAKLHAVSPLAMEVDHLGESYEGRSISCLKLGNGATRVLAWSQMHGDEPTHTAVLLALVNLLLRSPEHPSAKTILSSCTLYLIPMLNPDGAERYTRRNAQDIDINRDARHLQSPEGRLLRHAVENIQPHFALNLHNQGPRTSVHTTTQQAAAVSLLVPPINHDNTETTEMRRAKQVAVSFLQSVKPYCEGMISRYDADFMPRCFGEWVQQQGVSTLTIEAGGWSTPVFDTAHRVQLHFVGLVSLLEAIATETYLHTDPKEYDLLPRSSEHDLFDLMLQGVTVANGGTQSPFVADLGINYSASNQRRSPASGALIEDLGDLHVTSGKTEIDGAGLTCSPGRISYAPDISPNLLPDLHQVRDFLAKGVTTLIGQVNLAKTLHLDALGELSEQLDLPINLGFLAALPTTTAKPSPEVLERLVLATSRGIVGVLAEGMTDEVSHFVRCFQMPLLHEHELWVATDESTFVANTARSIRDMATRLGLQNRGTIQPGMAADLLLRKGCKLSNSLSATQCGDLHQVMVAGTVVFDEDELVSHTGGTLLTNRLTR